VCVFAGTEKKGESMNVGKDVPLNGVIKSFFMMHLQPCSTRRRARAAKGRRINLAVALSVYGTARICPSS